MTYLLGIDLGGSSVKAVAVTPKGDTLARYNESFDPDQKLHFAETIKDIVQRSTKEQGNSPERIGISAPGLAAKDSRSIGFMPGRLDGLVDLVWADHLGRTEFVPVLNDAQAALLGEVWLGAATGFTNVILLTLGTGVGGAAMVDGRLLRGHTGKAGHLGHVTLDMDGVPDVCDMPGSLEVQIGNHTIGERAQGKFATTHELIEAVRRGDAFAKKVWQRSLKALAVAIGGFTNVLDPEAVIIGGGIARAGNDLFQPLRRMVHEYEWKVCGHEVKLLPAQLGELAGAYGAAYRAQGFNEA
jgi:glucokinase